VGFLARLFGGGRTEPGLTHETQSGITDDLFIPADRKPLGTFEGNPSVLDELEHETGGPITPRGGGVFGAGADLAVHADLASDMESDEDRLEMAEERTWEALGADPHDVDGVVNQLKPGQSAIDADFDTYERDVDRLGDELGPGQSGEPDRDPGPDPDPDPAG
jgi:hypothetical protein